jgi:hypothetical protein
VAEEEEQQHRLPAANNRIPVVGGGVETCALCKTERAALAGDGLAQAQEVRFTTL